ncbi:MAG: hypothetical protein WC889_17070 [Myxococcota bacterium]
MKCQFCAEEIKDDAQLCRFCGAIRVDGQWQHLSKERAGAGRNLTIFTSGWLLLLSGAWTLLQCTSPVPLFGALRGGVVAVVYNVMFGAALMSMGYAMAQRKPWALRAVAIATAVYTMDKLIFILDSQARLAAMGENAQLINELDAGMGAMLDRVTLMTPMAFLVGWWGLVAYIYVKRGYFQPPSH